MNGRWKELAIMLAACLVTIPVPASAESGKELVAFLDLQSDQAVRDTATIVSALLRVGLVKTGVYEVIERQAMRAVLEEQALELTGVTDPATAVKTVKALRPFVIKAARTGW